MDIMTTVWGSRFHQEKQKKQTNNQTRQAVYDYISEFTEQERR